MFYYRYESEFQVPPPTWFSPNNPQPKPDNRTIPTTLDQYGMQLKLREQQSKKRAGKASQEQASDDWVPPPGWNEFVTADYQTQLKLLEQQNKTHIPMIRLEEESIGPVSGSVWTPPPGWRESLPPDSQDALKYLEQQHKTRLPLLRKEKNTTSMAPPITASRDTPPRRMSEARDRSGMPSPPTLPCLPYAAAGDYQMQLMMLEEQNKKRLMMARQEQDAMARQNQPSTPEIGVGFREQSVESNSTWSTQFTPESTPGFQEGREPSMGALNQIHLNFMESHPHVSDLGRYLPQSSCNCASSDQILRDHNLQVSMAHQQNHARETMVKHEQDDSAPSSAVPNWSLQHYQEELMLKEQRNRAAIDMRREQEEEMRAPTTTGTHALQDYQMQLMLLEQQNKKRKMIQRQNEQRKQEAKQQRESRKIEIQLRLLEQQNKERLMMAEEETRSQASTSAGPSDEQNLDKDQEGNGPAWISHGSRDLHKKPLVIRGRPTCDD
jgi:hypothetical protein